MRRWLLVLGLAGCTAPAASSVAAPPDVATAADVTDDAPSDVVDGDAPDTTLVQDDASPAAGLDPSACLQHTASEAQCKDCCDCLDAACTDVVACRDACPGHDFSSNDGSVTVQATTVLGPDGDYGTCTTAATPQACKACCDCDGHYACGDKAHCRDACVTAGSPWPALQMSQLGPPELLLSSQKFAEGPLWLADAGTLLFSDVDADTVFQLTLPSTVTTYRAPSGHANGLARAPDGALLVCEQGARRVTRLGSDGTLTVLADSWQGKPLNSPNDIVVAADGTVYFTDPTYGLGNKASDLGFTGVYRITPGGSLALDAQLDGQPNGIAVSPDGKSVLVALTTANKIVAFDVGKSGQLGKQHSFFSTTAPDGMAVDQAGNVYVAGLENGQGAVVVLNPIGKRLGGIALAHQPTNCGFGGADGKTLFVTAREAVYRIQTPIAGL